MSYRSKRELLAQVAPRYQLARHGQKSVILDAFIAATGYARKYAIRVLTQPPLPAPAQIRRPRLPHYGAAVQAALEVAWAAVNFVGAKRLVPFLPTLVPILERHHHLTLTESGACSFISIVNYIWSFSRSLLSLKSFIFVGVVYPFTTTLIGTS